MRYEDSMKGVADQIIKEQQRVSKILNIQVPASSFYKKKSCLFLTPAVLPHLSYYNDCKNRNEGFH